MPCESRGRTSCCRCGSHPLGLVLADSCLQGWGRGEKVENLLALWGGALLTSWMFLEDSVLSLHSEGQLHIQFVQVCPLVYRPRLSYPSPERAAPSRLSPIPRVQVLKVYLSPSFWRHPQTSVSGSEQCPKAHSRRLVVLCCWCFQIQLCSLQTQTDFLSSGRHSGGAERK